MQPIPGFHGICWRVAQPAIVDAVAIGACARRCVGTARHDDFTEEVEERRLHRGVAPTGPPDGAFDNGAVFGAPAILVDVGAIDRETGDDFCQRLAQAIEGEVARATVPFGDARERMSEHVQLARHGRRHDEALALIPHLVEGVGVPRQLRVGAAHAPDFCRVDEDAVEIVEVVVAGRAGDRPARRQGLVARENFLGEHVEIPAAEILQHREIARRVEEAVRVIDSHRLHAAVAQQLRQQLVGRGKDLRILDAQPRELVDVKKAPVVDLVRRGSPVRQPVGLRFEQFVQAVEAVGPARLAVHLAHGEIDRFPNRGRFVDQPCQPRSRHFFFALTFVDCGQRLVAVVAEPRKVLQRCQDAQELV